MAVTTPASWMNLICRSKMFGLSLSKPTMKPPITSMPAFWMVFTDGEQVALGVLDLRAFEEALLLRRLDADEHLLEAGLDHQVQQLGVVGQVQRRLGRELHRHAPPLGARRSARAETPSP